MKNIKTIVGVMFTGAIVGLSAPANAAQQFVESKTSADLIGGGPDSVITTVNYGVQGDNIEATIGTGYASAGDELVIRSEVRYYRYLGDNITLEAELETIYGTSSDNLGVSPELRVRKYF